MRKDKLFKKKRKKDVFLRYNLTVQLLIDNNLFCFVEGKDDRFFYYEFVKKQFPDYNIIFKEASEENRKGRREAVTQLCSFINNKIDFVNEYMNRKISKNQVLFFRDKDFHKIDKEQPENIFTTKYYSIENYLINKEVFTLLLRYYFDYDDITINEKKEKFDELFNEFYKKLINFNTILLLKNEIYPTKDVLNYDFNLFSHNNFKKYFKINRKNLIFNHNEGITLKDIKENIIKKGINNEIIETLINVQKFEEKKQIIKNTEIDTYMRGKYKINFLHELLREMYTQKNLPDTIDVPFLSLFYSNAILQKKLSIPEELEDFLKRNSNALKTYKQLKLIFK